MIYTMTLNPAIDQTTIIDNFELDKVNRVVDIRKDAGGKGINVSKMIKNLEGESVALGIVGGSTGQFIEDELGKLDIKTDFIHKSTSTRTNIKIVDRINNTFTDINEGGGIVDESILSAIEGQIKDMAEGDWLIFAGSVPSNAGKDLYERWVRICNEKGIKTILDADDELLENGVKAGPYLIKPNIHELEMFFDKKIEDEKECVALAKGLFDYGIKIIVVSMGADGCLLMTEDIVIKAGGLKVDVKSTVGAGDSMVGGLALALSQGASLEDALTLGVSCSTASIQNEGTIMGELEVINKIKEQVVLSNL